MGALRLFAMLALFVRSAICRHVLPKICGALLIKHSSPFWWRAEMRRGSHNESWQRG